MIGNVNRITIAEASDKYSYVSLLRIYYMEVWVGNWCGGDLVCNDTD